MTIIFWIPGKPVAKQRPKFSRHGRFVKTYTPEETVSYENLVKMCALEASRPDLPLDSAVYVGVYMYVERPKGTPKKVRYPKKRPDADNVMKAVLDGMNGILYRDDSQVVRGVWCKEFTTEQEGVRVEVNYLEVEGAK